MSNIAKVGSQQSKRAKRVEQRNTRGIVAALDDDDAMFARVTKCLGNRRFLITIWDGKQRRHIADIQAKIPGNAKRVRIDINDIVNVVGSGREWEIQAQIDPKSANKLKKEGRISAELLLSAESAAPGAKNADVGIEFEFDHEEEKASEDEKAEAEAVKVAKGAKGAKKLAVEDLSDGDIDEI